MEDAIKRIVERQFPELAGRLHVPRQAEVVAIREPHRAGDICDEYRPRHAVSVQLLDAHGKPDTRFPVIHDVPVQIGGAGDERGLFAFPSIGSRVELGMAYGGNGKPMVRGMLPDDRLLPDLEPGELRRQHSAESYDRIDPHGNHERLTNGAITDDSLTRIVRALESLESLTKSRREIDADESVDVGGLWRLVALGAINLQSAGRFDVAALGELQASSSVLQRYRAPSTWIGSEDENVLHILSEVIQVLIELCGILSSHTHPSTGPCSEGAEITAKGDSAGSIKARLDSITE